MTDKIYHFGGSAYRLIREAQLSGLHAFFGRICWAAPVIKLDDAPDAEGLLPVYELSWNCDELPEEPHDISDFLKLIDWDCPSAVAPYGGAVMPDRYDAENDTLV